MIRRKLLEKETRYFLEFVNGMMYIICSFGTEEHVIFLKKVGDLDRSDCLIKNF